MIIKNLIVVFSLRVAPKIDCVWKKVTLGYFQGVRIDFNNWPEQGEDPLEFRHSEKSRALISGEVKELGKKGVIEIGQECDGQYLPNLAKTEWES